MTGFTKLHGSLLDSSVWSESHATRIVWVTMLAMADEDGVVAASVSGLARRAVVSLEECRTALKAFLSPDPESRDKTSGERIEEVAEGWLVLNHANYRNQRTAQQVATAERVALHRERVKTGSVTPRYKHDVAPGNVTSTDVTRGNANSPSEAEAEAEAEAAGEESAARASAPPPPSIPRPLPRLEADPPPEKKRKPRRPRKPSVGPHPDAVRHWEAEWRRTRGALYDIQAVDGAAIAACLELAKGDLDEVKRRMTVALERTSQFWLEAASPQNVRKNWSQLAITVTPNSKPGVTDQWAFQQLRREAEGVGT